MPLYDNFADVKRSFMFPYKYQPGAYVRLSAEYKYDESQGKYSLVLRGQILNAQNKFIVTRQVDSSIDPAKPYTYGFYSYYTLATPAPLNTLNFQDSVKQAISNGWPIFQIPVEGLANGTMVLMFTPADPAKFTMMYYVVQGGICIKHGTSLFSGIQFNLVTPFDWNS